MIMNAHPYFDILMLVSASWSPQACFGGHKLFMYVMHHIRMSNLCWQIWFWLIFVWGTRGGQGRLIKLLQRGVAPCLSRRCQTIVCIRRQRHVEAADALQACIGCMHQGCVCAAFTTGRRVRWYVLIPHSLTDASRGTARIGCDTRGQRFSLQSH